MFPLRDDNPTQRTAVVTVILIIVNVVVWLYVQGAGYSERLLAESVCGLGMIPAEITGMAATPGAAGPCVPGGLTLGATVTSMFLHGSWLHLLANMWFLWLFGDNIEESLGHARFLVFYVLIGLAGAGAHILSDPSSVVPTIGASGAISGLMGAYLVLHPRARIQTLFVFVIVLRIISVPAWIVLIMWFALQGLAAYVTPAGASGVAVWAHIGGFIAGAVLVRLFTIGRQATADAPVP